MKDYELPLEELIAKATGLAPAINKQGDEARRYEALCNIKDEERNGD